MRKVWQKMRLLMIAVLLTAIPVSDAMAVTLVESAKNDAGYESLVINYLEAQAIDECLAYATNPRTAARAFKKENMNYDSNNDVPKLLSFDIDFNNSNIYSSLLESRFGQNRRHFTSDDKLNCSELGKDVLKKAFSSSDSDMRQLRKDLVCGASSPLKIYLGYTNDVAEGAGEGYKTKGIPDRFDLDDSNPLLNENECINNYDTLMEFINNNYDITGTSDGSLAVRVEFSPSRFSFLDWAKANSLGDVDSVMSEIKKLIPYLTFRESCGYSNLSEDEYRTNEQNGISGNHYVMVDPLSGANKYYWQNGNKDESVYVGDIKDKGSKITCSDLGKQLASEDYSKFINDNRKQAIENCYQQAQKDKQKISDNLDVLGRSLTLIDKLISAAKSKDEGKVNTYADSINNSLGRISSNSDSGAVYKMINSTSVFKEKSLEYIDGDLSDSAFNSHVSNYEQAKNDMRGVIDEAKDKLASVTDIDKNASGINGNGDVELRVDGFYEIDESTGELKCLAHDEMNNLVGEINGLVGSNISLDSYTSPLTETDFVTGDWKSYCYEAGIESMAWIICPALNNMTEATDGIDKFLNDWLSVDTGLLTSTGAAGQNNAGTYQAWGYFRDLANVAMILILLVVIFSQLTGVGIDNYGIKKILPKLIAMAVLVNLSYIICQVLVDLSNIFGAGLNDLFKTIGETISGGTTGREGVATIVAGLLATVVAAGAASPFILTIVGLTAGAGPMLIISLVLMILIALVAVIMFFVMLGARMIIVVVFVAIAPLALACYILPNTQAVFKKWWKVFEVALVMYPICGALYGMSFIIKAIVFAQGTSEGGIAFWLAIVAVAAPFLPFLALPALLKGAMSTLGTIGGAISSVGSGLRSGLSKANQTIQNTEMYKAEQRRMQKGIDLRRSGIEYDKKTMRPTVVDGQLVPRRSKWGTARDPLARAQAMASVMKNMEQDQLASDMLADGGSTAYTQMQARVNAQRVKNFEAQFENTDKVELSRRAGTINSWIGEEGGAQEVQALIKTMLDKGMENEVFDMLENEGDGRNLISNMTTVMSMLSSSKNKVLKAFGKRGFDQEANEGRGAGTAFKDFMNGNGWSSMKAYIEGKTGEFADGLDDKALKVIEKYSNDGNRIIETKQLVEIATICKDYDTLKHANDMLGERNDIQISGEELTKLDETTAKVLWDRAESDADLRMQLTQAAQNVRNTPQLMGKIAADTYKSRIVQRYAPNITTRDDVRRQINQNGGGGGRDSDASSSGALILDFTPQELEEEKEKLQRKYPGSKF